MSKKNSLKLVPYGTKKRRVDGVPYEEWPTVSYLMEWVGYSGGTDMRPNEPFTDTLRLDRLERGRSAARFWFVGSDGTEYPFFGQGLTDMLSKVTLVNGVVTATWIAVKRGANYGIELHSTEVAA